MALPKKEKYSYQQCLASGWGREEHSLIRSKSPTSARRNVLACWDGNLSRPHPPGASQLPSWTLTRDTCLRFSTAVCNSISNPVTKEMLFEFIDRCAAPSQGQKRKRHPDPDTELMPPPPPKRLLPWRPASDFRIERKDEWEKMLLSHFLQPEKFKKKKSVAWCWYTFDFFFFLKENYCSQSVNIWCFCFLSATVHHGLKCFIYTW